MCYQKSFNTLNNYSYLDSHWGPSYACRAHPVLIMQASLANYQAKSTEDKRKDKRITIEKQFIIILDNKSYIIHIHREMKFFKIRMAIGLYIYILNNFSRRI